MQPLIVKTNATENDVVRAFNSAFFDAPTLADHFKPTPIAHFRSQMTWSPTQVLDCVAAAKLVEVNFNRQLKDLEGLRSEIGETIVLSYDPSPGGGTVRIWVDNEPTIVGIDEPGPLVLHTYAHEIFTELKQAGFTVEPEARLADYHVPPAAPPGWPFPA